MWLNLLAFVIKAAVVVIAVAVVLAVFFALLARVKKVAKNQIRIKSRNDYYRDLALPLQQELYGKDEFKKLKKSLKKNSKKKTDADGHLFVLGFKGDIQAAAAERLREEINLVLAVAKQQDEVLLRLENAGGMVNAHGFAASQLERIRRRDIPLTVAVDKVAASGGYMMACVANRIIAAPFAVIGSIGVVAQLPNFHRFLKKHNVDFEQITAGKYKRTLTMFGENDEAGRRKMREEIAEIHRLFADFVKTYRPQLDIDQVSTGEYWLAKKAQELGLVDEIMTGDDYLMRAQEARRRVIEIDTPKKRSMLERMTGKARSELRRLLTDDSRFF